MARPGPRTLVVTVLVMLAVFAVMLGQQIWRRYTIG
ncbi:hypothetical protein PAPPERLAPAPP_01420 [Brevundimonas phage vB_BpoS-Papperlapapp]|uniref:Uncharacterized protein n=2 Tax=Marchewkavirus TaxID=3425052 RepID=A0A9E7SJF9_9CAUD|nr:hypothetical protein KABACHOK_05650 [Brevundimonas phage vB_BpoS-Kabachok]USN15884.1 hypothetical protein PAPPERLAPAPP_01420 [Brevundimonas phage vB_BpoS-Papperlapapp]UTC28657.1 hypothetical protein MARCHEWKA_01440 [Brevundimonas phage vB_BpoS-Marchewka]UTC29103.1 hypothetical protein BAMBUS_00200 [Brevundimonas phage vB_BpoS-Bambus]